MERSGKKEELDELQKQVIKCFKLIKLVVRQYCGAFFKTGGSLSREAGKHQRAIQAGHEVSREQYRVSLEQIPFRNYHVHERSALGQIIIFIRPSREARYVVLCEFFHLADLPTFSDGRLKIMIFPF